MSTEEAIAAAVTAALRNEFAGLREEVAAMLNSSDAPPKRQRRAMDGRLLSTAEAARRLGVSRGRTLPALIEQHRIRTVDVNGRPKIPTAEIERIEREGTSRVLTRPAAPNRSRRDAPLARDEIAKVKPLG